MANPRMPQVTDSTSNLPTNGAQQEELLKLASSLACQSKYCLSTLQDIEERPISTPPVRLQHFSSGGMMITTVGLRGEVNGTLQEVAADARHLLGHLGLSTNDAAAIQSLTPRKAVAGTEADTQEGELFLAGLIEEIDCDGQVIAREDAASVARADALRLKVLIGLMERLSVAATGLCSKLDRKLNPPSMRERVYIDRSHCRVTVDGGPSVEITSNQAIALHHLVEANGNPISGLAIAREEGLKEFKIGLYVKQLARKHPAFGRIIKKEQKGNGRFYIELPPLD
jgi:hypothetical protein